MIFFILGLPNSVKEDCTWQYLRQLGWRGQCSDQQYQGPLWPLEIVQGTGCWGGDGGYLVQGHTSIQGIPSDPGVISLALIPEISKSKAKTNKKEL